MLWLILTSLAGVPTSLPPGESAAHWQAAFELAGLEPASWSAATVRIRVTGSNWEIVARAPDGRERSETVLLPNTPADREELAFLAQGLVRDLGLAKTPNLRPLSEPPPPPPPPPPAPEPAPEAEPEPEPEPVLKPPPPQPAPAPKPQPEPAPKPDTGPAPVPTPPPAPRPVPPPEPAPTPTAPAPDPVAPEPVPEPTIEPNIEPEPVAEPVPAPQPEPVPQGGSTSVVIDTTVDPLAELEPKGRQRRAVAVPGLFLGVATLLRSRTSPAGGFEFGVVPFHDGRWRVEVAAQLFLPAPISFGGIANRSLMPWLARLGASYRVLPIVDLHAGIGISALNFRQQFRPIGTRFVPTAAVGASIVTVKWRGFSLEPRVIGMVDLTPVQIVDEFNQPAILSPVTGLFSLVVKFSGFGDPSATLPTSKP